MTVVFLVLAAVMIVVGIGALANAINGPAAGAEEWARANGVTLSPATRPVVATFLRNGRSLRRVGAVGGLVVPPAITAATGIDLHLSGIVWVLLGYLAGQTVAELTLARVPATEHRSASLATRRLLAYLPWPLAIAQVVLPLASLGLGVIVLRVAGGTAASTTSGTDAALAAGPLAVVLAVAVLVGERSLVRRPQPLVEPELVALDDAMRSSSVRAVAATSVAITSLLITTQNLAIVYEIEPSPAQGVLMGVTVLVLVFSLVAWQSWVNRGWRGRPARPRTINGAAS